MVGEVAAVKRTTGVPIKDSGREAALIADRRSIASRSGLSPEVIENLFRHLNGVKPTAFHACNWSWHL